MAKYRSNLPQLSGDIFLTDGGLETELIFHKGFELPYFASFVLLKNEKGIEALREYYLSYISIARNNKVGFILESPTWRASSDWGEQMGYSDDDLADINRKAIELVNALRTQYETENTKMVISGCIGPQSDGYRPSIIMNEDEAERYHSNQIKTFSETDADMVSVLTITYSQEAIGIARAAKKAGMPIIISFTVETNGRLPSNETLKEAIERVDASTNNTPAYYMINCAHPTHFQEVLAVDEPWVQRIRGIRANASTMSHAELDKADELDDGDPVELGGQYHQLRNILNTVNVLGGCCGTDTRHIQEIANIL